MMTIILDNSLFISVMTDLTGKVVIHGEDPRWVQLFSIDILPDLMSTPASLTEYCERWSRTNPNTKNFLHFVEQVSSRVRYLQKKGAINNEAIYEACLGLYIATVTFQYFIGNLTIDGIRDQLLLPLPWPEHIDEKFDYRKKRNGVFHAVENLIIDCIIIIGTMNAELNDVKFFAIELLICLLSPSLYNHHTSSHPSTTNHSHQQTMSIDPLHYDIFQKYILKIAFGDLQHTAVNGGFSDNIAAKIVKGLMLNITSVVMPLDASGSIYTRLFGDSKATIASEGVLLNKLQARFKASSASQKTSTNTTLGNYFTGLIQYVSFSNTTLGSSSSSSRGLEIQSSINQQTFPKYVLSERSMQLLLLLLHQQQLVDSMGGGSINPFRDMFSLLIDESIDCEDHEDEVTMLGLLNVRGPSTSASLHIQKLHLDFRLLFKYFIEFLPNANVMLLLYTFLSMHPTFLELLRVTENINEMLLKCLFCLYAITDLTPLNDTAAPRVFTVDMKHQLCTAIQCLQYILHDTTLFHTNPCLLLEIEVAWYPVVGSSKMKVMDLTLLLLLRVLKFSIYTIQDYELLTNVLTILKHLFPSIENMLPRTAEVLARTLLSCMKRLFRVYQKEHGSSNRGSTRLERSFSDVSVSDFPFTRFSSTSDVMSMTGIHPSISLHAKKNHIEVPSYSTMLSQVVTDLIILSSSILRLKLPQNCQFLYCLIVVFDKIQSCLSPEQSPLSSILLAMKSSPLKSSPYDQTSVQRMLLTEENENDDTNIKEHIGYLLHIITFYYHAMETAKAVQKEDEYFSAEEAMQILQTLIDQYEPSSHRSAHQQSQSGLELESKEEVGLSQVNLLDLTTEKDFQTIPPHPFYYPDLFFALEEEIAWYKKRYAAVNNATTMTASSARISRHHIVSFLLPYIWTNILLSTPEFPWRWNKISLINDLGMT